MRFDRERLPARAGRGHGFAAAPWKGDTLVASLRHGATGMSPFRFGARGGRPAQSARGRELPGTFEAVRRDQPDGMFGGARGATRPTCFGRLNPPALL